VTWEHSKSHTDSDMILSRVSQSFSHSDEELERKARLIEAMMS